MKLLAVAEETFESSAFAVTDKVHEAILSECIPIVHSGITFPEEFDKRGAFFYADSEQLNKILDSLSIDLYRSMYFFVQKNLQTSYSRHARSSNSH